MSWFSTKGNCHGEEEGSGAKKTLTKTEILNALVEETELSKKEVSSVFDALGTLLGQELGKKGPGMMNIPGLMKVKVIRKPATKARKGINPFTKEETVVQAKPARNVVKILPLKGLKDMV
ncbi:MAG: HU family DNA-binding protein [Planctomycetaceae bacterium]|nr:HU family DNA-binding protein [Planctomycetaceae bacterium]